jgi:phosphoribosylglycinamide formyltransferase-1
VVNYVLRSCGPPRAPQDRKTFRRRAYDAGLADRVAAFQPDWIVLAGWMRVLSSAFLEHFPNRVVNLHPALPGGPQGTWQEVMWQLMSARALEAGAMMHLATPMLDAGPPVAYFRFPLSGAGRKGYPDKRVLERIIARLR